MTSPDDDEISEELRRLRKEGERKEPMEACLKAHEMEPQDMNYEPEVGATRLKAWTRTERTAESASLAALHLSPSVMDAEKRALLDIGTFDVFVEGWIHDLSLFKLCKVKTTGDLLPFPVDSIMGHPSFSGEDLRVLLVLKGILCADSIRYMAPIQMRRTKCQQLMSEVACF